MVVTHVLGVARWCVCLCSCSVMPDSLHVIILKNGCKHANRKEGVFIFITYMTFLCTASSPLSLITLVTAAGWTCCVRHQHDFTQTQARSALLDVCTAHHQPWDFPAGAETRVSVYTHPEPVNVQTRNTMRLRPCKTNFHPIRYRKQ